MEETPATLEEVAATLASTLGTIWTDFISHLPFLTAALAILALTWAAAAAFRRLSRPIVARWKLRSSLRDLVVRLMSIGIWGAGLLVAAMILFPGLTPAKALGSLGLLSVAVGFAFRDIFENFFAGILILWRFPFDTGDFIECEGIMGRVEDVTVRMTRIRKTTGELVVVPNSVLFKHPVDVLTDERQRRVDVMAGVSYDTDVADAVEVIRKAVKHCDTVHEKPEPQVLPHAFGASSVDIEVAWWTDPEPLAVRRSRGEVVVAIKEALDDAEIEIPFPYRTLTFKESLPLRQADFDNEEKRSATG